MHHYCTVTADSLAAREDLRHVWRIIKPKEAYESDVVLHAILALAAMHKAYLMPGSRLAYLQSAARHQTLASEGCRVLLSNISEHNWTKIYCFATVFTIYCLCAPIRSAMEEQQDIITSLLELISAVRGVNVVLGPYMELLHQTEYAPTVFPVWPLHDITQKSRYVNSSLNFLHCLTSSLLTSLARSRSTLDRHSFQQIAST